MTTGEKIRFYREKSNLTQEAVAEALDTTPQNIYKYEKDIVQNIPIEKIKLLAKLFNIPPYILLGWDDAEEDTPFDRAMRKQKTERELTTSELSALEKKIICEYRNQPKLQARILETLGINADAYQDEEVAPLRAASRVKGFDENGNIVFK